MDRPFHVLSADDIKDGLATDAYFVRTEETLEFADRNPTVTAEVTADQFGNGAFEVFAGLDEVLGLLEGLPVDVEALPEGTLFDGGPVVQVSGPYRSFLRFETALLGLVSQASAYATKSLAARTLAEETSLLSFGSRHLHPAIAPMVERAALIGGFDGYSNVGAEELIGGEATGTMPHALLLVFGEEHLTDAWQAFDAAVGPDVPRIALCDTFTDERVESLAAARALDDALDGVRLDTTGSRRGDFEHIVREVRWELDANGYDEVDIVVSGGIDLEAIDQLEPLVDGFGIGSFITDAAPVDFAFDLVTVDGEPTAKRGKLSGPKSVYRTPHGGHEVRPRSAPTPADADALLEPVMRDGERVGDADDIDTIANRAMADAAAVDFDPWNHA